MRARCRAAPSLPEVYDDLSAEIIDLIGTAGELDGFFFDIHGAMSVVGRQDAEADLATRVRAALGPDVLVSTSMDLHGNVSRELGTAVDLITCYRMAPHEDAMESRERAARNLVERLRSGLGKPRQGVGAGAGAAARGEDLDPDRAGRVDLPAGRRDRRRARRTRRRGLGRLRVGRRAAVPARPWSSPATTRR